MTDNQDFNLDTERQTCRLLYPGKATQLLLWSLALRTENKEIRNLSPEAPKKKIWKRNKNGFPNNTLKQHLNSGEELVEDRVKERQQFKKRRMTVLVTADSQWRQGTVPEQKHYLEIDDNLFK